MSLIGKLINFSVVKLYLTLKKVVILCLIVDIYLILIY